MKYEDIKDFNTRCEEHPDHQTGMISHGMIQQRLHEEIDELRDYIEQAEKQEPDLPPVGIGVDVTAEGATVVGFYRRPNAVSEMFYSEFHPSPSRKEWVGLTEDEMVEIRSAYEPHIFQIMFATEAKLRSKNDGSV